MRIKMKSTATGPNVNLQEGREYDLPDDVALVYLQGGYADPVAVKPEARAEVAVVEPPEERSIEPEPEPDPEPVVEQPKKPTRRKKKRTR